ncbi:hypothetical protein LX32DRAFT_415651 [Colletotrichum zoysiae]|uniref:Uncharacterized protein n=1 Tax=Colletotrichum zoysiae TaxID=1216348 RepID=A0AAD9HH78_9PEZI|nr:hypothetical protein LX32DRAFT_415651 [Colletotrichum zoysiae]
MWWTRSNPGKRRDELLCTDVCLISIRIIQQHLFFFFFFFQIFTLTATYLLTHYSQAARYGDEKVRHIDSDVLFSHQF